MPTVAIVYHSGFGHTEAVARSVAEGLGQVSGVKASLIKTSELPSPGADKTLGGRWAELAAADAIVFGTPTYMGSVSADFKRFMDASAGPWFKQAWKDKLAAGFTNSGSPSGDKLNTLVTLAVFAGQHSMVWVSQGIFNDGQNNRLGGWLGYMSQSDNAPADQTPPPQDHATARAFGQRVGIAAVRWAKGA
jgi:multimeric flavodoxin WrbA